MEKQLMQMSFDTFKKNYFAELSRQDLEIDMIYERLIRDLKYISRKFGNNQRYKRVIEYLKKAIQEINEIRLADILDNETEDSVLNVSGRSN